MTLTSGDATVNWTVLSFGVEKRTGVMVNAWEVDVELFVSKSTGDSPYFIGVSEFEILKIRNLFLKDLM